MGLLDKSGSQVVSYTYDSWGKLISIDGSLKDTVGVKNPYRYRGYRYDTETGLYYLESRYYNPEWGRFINADAIAGSTGDLLSHNVFAYCKNDPVNNCDFYGYLPHRTTINYEEMKRLAHAQPAYHSSRRAASRRKSTTLRRKNSKTSDACSLISTVMSVSKMDMSIHTAAAGLEAEDGIKISGYGYLFTTPFAVASHITDPYLTAGEKFGLSAMGIGLLLLEFLL